MGVVMIKCPNTAREISTGIVTDRASFESTPVFFAQVYCPICRTEHEWFAKDAWVCDAPSLERAMGAAMKLDRLSLVIFRIVLLIVWRATGAARVVVLLLGKLAARSLLTLLIDLLALLFWLINAATLLAALPLTLCLRHGRVPRFG